MVTLGEHTFNQGADPVVKIGFRNVATDTWVTVDNDTVTLQVLYYTHYHTTNYTSCHFLMVIFARSLSKFMLGVKSERHDWLSGDLHIGVYVVYKDVYTFLYPILWLSHSSSQKLVFVTPEIRKELLILIWPWLHLTKTNLQKTFIGVSD